MSVYLVTWDLNRERPTYATTRAELLARLSRYDGVKDKGLDSVRFVSTSSNAGQVSDDLRKPLDENDRIVVVKMTSASYDGWLSTATWDWINARV